VVFELPESGPECAFTHGPEQDELHRERARCVTDMRYSEAKGRLPQLSSRVRKGCVLSRCCVVLRAAWTHPALGAAGEVHVSMLYL
jgi:hypothetical protein